MVYLAIKNGWIFPWRTVSHNQMVNLHSFTCDTTLAPWNVSETFQKHQGYFSSYPMTDPAGAGILMLTWLGYIDGIHGTPYIAAPWIPWVLDHDPFMSSTWYGETPNLIPSWSAIKKQTEDPRVPQRRWSPRMGRPFSCDENHRWSPWDDMAWVYPAWFTIGKWWFNGWQWWIMEWSWDILNLVNIQS